MEQEIIRVLYDHQAFTKQIYGGVSRCFVELYKHIPQGVHAQIAVKESDNVYIRDLQEVQPANDRYNKFLCKRDFKGKRIIHQLYDKLTHSGYYPNYNENYSIELLKKGDFDVFHPTYFDDYFLPYLKDTPFVLTIHDMIPELYPQYFSKDDKQIVMKRKLVPLANAIITVSETTKRDVIRILDVPENKVHVVYHGCSFPKQGKDCLSINNGKPYILYVGERGYYKNFNLFTKYIYPFLESHPDISVICTGAPFKREETLQLLKEGLSNRFHHFWVSTDEEFFSLYHQALCFVYTSEYEGFGIPILEAYQADCPVLLNNASCFPEIAGDAAIYFEMDSNSSDIVDKLEYIYSLNLTERDSFIKKQRKRLALYSWGKSAIQLVDVYKSILK